MIPLDIETKPRPDLVLRFIKPPEPFDPAGVKYGNTKDPEKRAALFAQKQLDHETDVSDYWAKAKDRAALNPLTAEIVAIGLLIDGKVRILSGPERVLLLEFWELFVEYGAQAERFVYWSGNGNAQENFDPEMIIRRSWILGVRISALAFNGRFLSNRFDDAAGRYLLFKRETFCGLSRAADELNLFQPGAAFAPKSEKDEVTGANFWQYFAGTVQGTNLTAADQRTLAVCYLSNDLLLLNAVAERIY